MGRKPSRRQTKLLVAALVAVLIASWSLWSDWQQNRLQQHALPATTASGERALDVLKSLPVKDRAPKTGYSRVQFGGDWAADGACDVRERILARDMTNVAYKSQTDCTVMSGTLSDPYTGTIIHFYRGPDTSSDVQIDHVVALGNAWQTGAQQLSATKRVQLYNDPLELLAVDGPANEQKGDGDAATWLPPNKAFRCRYVSRQIAVKRKYQLWVTAAEHDAMQRILDTCPTQILPVVTSISS